MIESRMTGINREHRVPITTDAAITASDGGANPTGVALRDVEGRRARGAVALHAQRQGSLHIGWQYPVVPGAISGAPNG